jgi:hypothetical protein
MNAQLLILKIFQLKMGIKDLLPHLKSIQQPKNISDYAGLTVAVDGYCWYLLYILIS